MYVWTCYIRSKILHGAWGTGCVGQVSKLGPDDVAGTYASSPPNLNHPLEICSVCHWAGTQQAVIVFSSNLAYFHAGCLLHTVWLFAEWRSFTVPHVALWVSSLIGCLGNFGTCYSTVPGLSYTTISVTGRTRREKNDMVSVYRWGWIGDDKERRMCLLSRTV